MQIRELLDELLTSLETGPLISAVRHFEAKPPVFAPFPSSPDPRIVEALKGRRGEPPHPPPAQALREASQGRDPGGGEGSGGAVERGERGEA